MTVYYERSTGGCQNKTTGMQMSPRDPEPTGTTTTMQTLHGKTSQAGGTQTTPPPSPKKSRLMGGTQMSPPKDNSCEQVGQGQPDHNQDKEGQPTENTSHKEERKTRSQILRLHPILAHLQDHQSDQGMTSCQGI